MSKTLTTPSEAIQAFVLCQQVKDRLIEEDMTWPLSHNPRRLALHMLRLSLERMRQGFEQYPASVIHAAFTALVPQDER